MKNSLVIHSFILSAAIITMALCWSSGAHAQAVATVTIGPCKVIDTDGGDNILAGGYVAGLCDPAQIASFSATDNGAVTVVNTGNPYIQWVGRIPLTGLDSGAFTTSSSINTYLFGQNPVPGKIAFFLRDTPVSVGSGLGEEEFAIGQRAGFTPVLVANLTNGTSQVLVSVKVTSCARSSFVALPTNIVSNVFGYNLTGIINTAAAATGNSISDITRANSNGTINGPFQPRLFSCNNPVGNPPPSTK